MNAWIISALVIGAWFGASPAEDGASVWLQRLQSGSAEEREQAQRWLGSNLEVEHYPLLAREARRADAEARRRLSLALASEPQHLQLALLLLGEKDSSLTGIGEAAFQELVTNWCPKIDQVPAAGRHVERGLADGFPQVFSYAGGVAELELHIDRLDRHAAIGVPVVLDPELAARVATVDGDQAFGFALLASLCSAESLTFRGMGDWSGERPLRGAWIFVSAKTRTGAKSGAARLLSWFREVESSGSRAAPAARALAISGWPAALDWLDRRWAERADSNALEGLLAAASRGRVSRSMWTRDLRVHLLDMADRALNESERRLDAMASGASANPGTLAEQRAERIARGLIGAGGMELGGELSSDLWMANWRERNTGQRWLRLVILEGQHLGGASVETWLAGLLFQDPPLPPALQFQVLRTLAAMPLRPRTELQLSRWDLLVTWAFQHQQEETLVQLTTALGLTLDRNGLPVSRRTQLLFLHLALLNRDVDGAARECLQVSRTPDRRAQVGLVERMESARFEVGPALVRRVSLRALEGAQGEAASFLKRSFLLAGALVEVPAKEDLPDASKLDASAFAQLGAWAGVRAGGEARAILLAAVQDPPDTVGRRQALIAALSLAYQRLLEAGEDLAAEELQGSVWRAVRGPGAGLKSQLEPSVWPAPAPSLVIDILAQERRVPPLD